MKLLFCGHCHGVVRLFPERRSCKCGQSWGQYLPDDSTTVQTPYSLSLGIANSDFHTALDVLMQDRNRFSPLLSLRAWFNPDSELDVQYLAEEETEEASAASDGGGRGRQRPAVVYGAAPHPAGEDGVELGVTAETGL